MQKLVIGSDVVGSSVRLTARKADGGHQFDISLRRQSINFMNTFQIYTELLEQLISMSKRDKDMQNLVRRVSLKIQEIVRFQSSQLDELYGNLEVYQSSADELIRMIRSILQEQQKSEVNPEANPVKGSTHSSTDRPFTADPGASGFTNDSVLSRGATARNESLESEIRRLSTLLSKSTLMPGGGGEEDLDSLTLKQQVRDLSKELTAQSLVLDEALQREHRANSQVPRFTFLSLAVFSRCLARSIYSQTGSRTDFLLGRRAILRVLVPQLQELSRKLEQKQQELSQATARFARRETKETASCRRHGPPWVPFEHILARVHVCSVSACAPNRSVP